MVDEIGGSDLRRKAEELAQAGAAQTSEELAGISPETLQKVIFELRVHQIELELQNEELLRAQVELGISKARFFDLYELAPVGYCTLSEQGLIQEANLTLATLLGVGRKDMVGRPLARFIHKEDQDARYLHFNHLADAGSPKTTELRIVRQDGEPLWVSLETTSSQDEAGYPIFLVVITDISKRKLAEAAKLESEGQFHDYIEYAPIGVFITDETGRYLHVNPSASRLTGYTREELLERSIPELVAPDWREKVFEAFQQVIERGYSSVEVGLKRADGTHGFMSVEAVRLSPSRLLGFASDITERKQAEERLKRSDEELKHQNDVLSALLKTIPIGIFMVESPSGKPLVANEVARDLLGRGISPNVSKGNLSEVYKAYKVGTSDQYPLEERPIIRGLGGVASHVDDMVVERPDGTQTRLEVFGSPVVDDQGQVWASVVSFLDITERKKAECYREMGRDVLQILNEPGNIQESVQRVLSTLKTRTNFSAVAIRLQDGEDFPYFVQEGFSEEFLLSEASLIERGPNGGACRGRDGAVCLECTCGLVISGKTNPAHALFTARGSAWTNDSFPILDLPLDEDPRLHPRNICIHQGYASIALVPIRTPDRIVGLIQFNDRRKGCFTLETVELLEEIAAQIGSALMRKRFEEENARLQAQLIQSQKMESLGTLAGGVAHDMNNVLGAILALSSAHLDSLPKENPLYYSLETIRDAAIRGGDMVKRLLAFSRKTPSEKRELNLNALLLEEARLLERTTLAKVLLAMDLAPDLHPILGDGSALTHALMNLCVNAVDAMNDGGTLTFRTRNLGMDQIEVTLEDNGSGMTKEVLDRAMDPFFTTKAIGKGTGLGLSLVFTTVNSHGGQLKIQSELGKGTQVTMTFPATFAQHYEPGQEVPIRMAMAGQPLHVLLVDDDELVQKSTRMLVEVLGHSVTTTVSGEDALDLLEHGFHPDAVILDMNMPGLGGKGTLPRLRYQCPTVPVLLATGRADQEALDLIAAHPFVTLLSKPFSFEELRGHLDQVAGHGPSGH